jgi:serine/threonine protein kinase
MGETGGYGKFRVLARSPFGLTYRARAERLGGDIVMRIYPLELGAVSPSASFVGQMRELAQIRGRGIVTPIEVGHTDAGAPYVTRRFVDGPSLENLVPMASNDIEAWIGQVGWFGSRIGHAIGALHEQGIIHGSLRPSNVFLTGVGSLHVTDVVPWATWTLGLHGVYRHPDHVAPEVLAGDLPDRDSDVFSLASVLRSLVGHEVISNLPRHLAMLFDEALDARAGRRPPLTELLDAFEAIESGHGGFDVASPTALSAGRPQPALGPSPGTVNGAVSEQGDHALPGAGRMLSQLIRRIGNVRRRTDAGPRQPAAR